MTPGIYEFGPRQSEKAYGGNSTDIGARWSAHRRMLRKGEHHCAHLQNAWNKHGEDAFEFRVLEVIEDADKRLVAEQAWLDVRHAEKTCYNIAITAGPAGPLSEEHRRNLSEALVGNQNSLGCKHTDEQCRKQGERMTGNQYCLGHQNALGCTHSEEANQLKGERMMGNQRALGSRRTDAERREKSASMMGNQYALGHKQTEGHRRKIGAAHRGRKHTKEHKRKRSESMKRWWANKKAANAQQD